MRALLVAILFLLTVSLSAQASRQADNWHFGNGISIQFADGEPVLDPPSSMMTFEGACSLSDGEGNLLFYTNGGGRPPGNGGGNGDQDYGTIWNRNHEVMYDMRGAEGGGFSARQSAIAFPAPGDNPDLYYLFTMEEAEFDVGGAIPGQPNGRGLSYFTIDMSLNGGLGGVVLADQRVQNLVYEGLDATPMEGADGYWVVCHNNGTQGSNDSYVVPVTTDGVGEPRPLATSGPVNGRIKFSPNGRYLYHNGNLYRFDPAVGEIVQVIGNFSTFSDANVTFSPDSRFIYGTQPIGALSKVLVRYDVETSARVLVGALEEPGEITLVNGPFQIGPNGNIYFVEQNIDPLGGNTSSLSEIRCVNSAEPILERGVLDLTQFLGDGFFPNSPPQFVDAIFQRTAVGDTIVLEPLEVISCPQDSGVITARETGLAYRWSTGDTTQTIRVFESGRYCVTITDECGATVDCQDVTVRQDAGIRLATTESAVPCVGESIELLIVAAAEDDIAAVAWEDGSTDNPRTVIAALNATYTATVVTLCNDTVVVETTPTVMQFCDCTDAIPELITPNGDGTNDRFRLFTNCPVEDYTLLIYNRWGQPVFDSTNPAEGWDGTNSGTPANMDTYLYRMVFRFPGEEGVQERSGQFSLVR